MNKSQLIEFLAQQEQEKIAPLTGGALLEEVSGYLTEEYLETNPPEWEIKIDYMNYFYALLKGLSSDELLDRLPGDHVFVGIVYGYVVPKDAMAISYASDAVSEDIDNFIKNDNLYTAIKIQPRQPADPENVPEFIIEFLRDAEYDHWASS